MIHKSILITSERGAGDCFQFVRYVRRLSEMAETVWFSLPNRLICLMESALEDCHVCGTDNLPKTVYYNVPLISLPHFMS